MVKSYTVEETSWDLGSMNYRTAFRFVDMVTNIGLVNVLCYSCFYLKVILHTCLILEEPEEQSLIFIFSIVCSLSHTIYSNIKEVTTNISILYLDFLLEKVFYYQTLSIGNVTHSHHHSFFERCCWLILLKRRSLYILRLCLCQYGGRDFHLECRFFACLVKSSSYWLSLHCFTICLYQEGRR